MPRSLLPREHGAYVQLAAPLVASFAAFGVTLASALLALGACAAFLANEPLLVVLGHRGRRAKSEAGVRALRLLTNLAMVAVLAGLGGLLRAPASVAAAAIAAVPAAVLVAFAWRRAERTLAGELVACVTLTGAAAPVAIAAGASLSVALWAWAGWAIGYAFTVVAVHRVIARHKKSATSFDLAIIAAAVAIAIGLVLIGWYVAVPLAASSLAVMAIAPRVTHLRAIGFVLVGVSLVSVVIAA